MKTIKSKKTVTTKPAADKLTAKSSTTPTPISTPAAAPARATSVTPVAKAPVAPAAKLHREITSECIAARAYSLWEQQGRPQGRDFELWLQAESQLKQTSQSFAA